MRLHCAADHPCDTVIAATRASTIAVVLACTTIITACGSGDDAAPSTLQKGSIMQLRSRAYVDGGRIPLRYTCDGEDVSPPFTIEGVPEGTVSLALVMDDPDAPGGTWVHWVLYDLDPVARVAEGADVGVRGTNSWGALGYGGPCPPEGVHRYITTVYALAGTLGLGEGATKAEVFEAMDGLVITQAAFTGTYHR